MFFKNIVVYFKNIVVYFKNVNQVTSSVFPTQHVFTIQLSNNKEIYRLKIHKKSDTHEMINKILPKIKINNSKINFSTVRKQS